MKSAWFGIGLLLLLMPTFSFSREYFERGDAIYRAGAYGFGHSGLYIDWDPAQDPASEGSQHIVDAPTEGIDSVVARDFKAFHDGRTLWGTRKWRHALPESWRRMIADVALGIVKVGAKYSPVFYKNPFGNPRSFRCDGLVEYCYEITLGDPWLPGFNGGIIINDDFWNLCPATQMIALLPEGKAVLDSLTIVCPIDGDTLADSIYVAVHISDGYYGSGTEKVQLWADDDTVHRLEETTRDTIWSSAQFNWDSRKAKNGRHILHARGFDQAGNDALDSITIFVDNPTPRVTRTYPDTNHPQMPPDTTLWVEFNKGMDTTSVENAILFQPQTAVHMNWDDSSRLLLLEPELDLEHCSEYTLTISESARDSQGRRLDGDGNGEPGGEFRLTFHTAPPKMRIWAKPAASHVKQGESAIHRIFVQNLSRETISGEVITKGSTFGWELEPAQLSSPFVLKPDSVHTESIRVKNVHAVGPIDVQFGAKLEGCEKYCELYSWVAGDHICDHPDETFDISDRSYSSPWLVDTESRIGILLSGWGDGLGHLLGEFKIPTAIVKPDLTILNASGRGIKDLDVLLVGSAGLAGLETSPSFTEKLDDYIYNGGAVIVLSQQNSEDFDCLPGFGLRAKGWNQDQSCYWKAAYMDHWHPILAGQTEALVDCSVDGYFPAWPDSSDLILRRTATTMPCLLTYTYGEGTVLVTSMFTDWGLGHSQTTLGEKKLLRDIVTWAIDTDHVIPEFPSDERISLDVAVRNSCNKTASSAICAILNPNRDTLSVDTVPLTPPLEPQQERTLSVYLPAQKELGIYPICVILFDAKGRATGNRPFIARFLVKKEIDYRGHRPGGLKIWATTETEFVTEGREVAYEVSVSNNENRAFDGKIMIGVHEDDGRWWALIDSVPAIHVPAESTVTFQFLDTLYLSTSTYFGIYEDDADASSFFKDAVSCAEKGVWVGLPRCEMMTAADKDTSFAGENVRLRVQLMNRLPMEYEADFLVKFTDPDRRIIDQRTAHVNVDPIFGALDSIDFFIPPSSSPGIYSFEASCIYDSATLAKSRTCVVVPEPNLVAHFYLPDAVAGRMPIRLYLSNVGAEPDSGGTVVAALENPRSDTVWEGEYAFGTMAPAESTLVNLEPRIQTLIYGAYTLRLSVLHEGSPLTSSLEMRAMLLPRVLLEPARPVAGQRMDMRLQICNAGRFVMNTGADIRIPGWFQAERNLTVRPDEAESLDFSLLLPDTLSPGYHEILLTLSSDDTLTATSGFFLAGPSLFMGKCSSEGSAGGSIAVLLRNVGAASCLPDIRTVLTDCNNNRVCETEQALPIAPSAQCSLSISIPSEAVSGDYTLEVFASDSSRHFSQSWRRQLQVSGISCSLKGETGQEAYTLGDTIDAHAALHNGPIGFDGRLRWNIESERPAPGMLRIDADDPGNTLVGCCRSSGAVEISRHSAWLETSFVLSDSFYSVPSYIAVDRAGFIYASDFWYGQVFKLAPDGRVVGKWGKYGTADGEFRGAFGIAVDDSGLIYVSDYFNHRIQKFTTDGQFVEGWALDAEPSDICMDDSGHVYVAEPSQNRIQKLDREGHLVAEWGEPGAGDGQFNAPYGLGTDGTAIYVADTYNNRVQVFRSDGSFIGKWGKPGNGEGDLTCPSDVAVSPDGFVYTGECGPWINKFTREGGFITRFHPPGECPASWSVSVPEERTLYSCGYYYTLCRYSMGTRGMLETKHEFTEPADRALAFFPIEHPNGGTISYYYDLDGGWQPVRQLTEEDLRGKRIRFKAVMEKESQPVQSPRLDALSLLYMTDIKDALLWQDSTELEAKADSDISLSAETVLGAATGRLYLNAELTNGMKQTVQSSSCPFFISPGNLLLYLQPGKDAYTPGEEIRVCVKVGNSSDHEMKNTELLICAAQDTFFLDTLDLGPSQWDTVFVTTLAESSFTLFVSALSPPRDSAYVAQDIGVMPRSAALEIHAPACVSHDPFEASFRLINTCPHTLGLHMGAKAGDSVVFSLDRTLAPFSSFEKTHVLQLCRSDSIGFEVHGDIDTSVSRFVSFGERAQILPGIQERYEPGSQKVSLDVVNTGTFDLDYFILVTLRDSLGMILAEDSLTGFVLKNECETKNLLYRLGSGEYTVDYSLHCIRGDILDRGQVLLFVRKPYSAEIDSIIVSSGDSIPCGMVLAQVRARNTGAGRLTGSLSLNSSFAHAAREIELEAGEKKTFSFNLQPDVPEGDYAFLISIERFGDILDSLRSELYLAPSYEIETSGSVSGAAGERVSCPLTITNSGSAIGLDAVFFDFPSVFEDSQSLCIEPCSAWADSFTFAIPPDFEGGSYLASVSVGDEHKDILFEIAGLKVSVLADLDRKTYALSDTARLSLYIRNLEPVPLDLDIRVNSGSVQLEDSCDMAGLDTTAVSFSIPAKNAGDRVFYGLYLENGRALHLGSVLLITRSDSVCVYTDAQDYTSGDTATVIVEANVPGSILLSVFGDTIHSDSADVHPPRVAFPFEIPDDVTTGGYELNYQFRPEDDSEVVLEGSHPFNVLGYTVRMVRCSLDKTKYRQGDSLKADCSVSSNRNVGALLQAWIEGPDGYYTTCYKRPISLAAGHNSIHAEGRVETRIPGPSTLIYGIFKQKPPHNEYGLLLAAGSKGIEVGPRDTTPPEFIAFSFIPETLNPLKGDVGRINLMLSESCEVCEVRIVNESRRSVANWVMNGLSPTMHSLTWDGRNVRAGGYTVISWAYDYCDNISDTARAGFNVCPDTTPPTTTLNVGEPMYAGNPIFVTGRTRLSLSAVDDLSGVRHTEYSLASLTADTNPSWNPYTKAFTTDSPDGSYILRARSVDKAGNMEEAKESVIAVDNSPPLVSFNVSEPHYEAGTTYISAETRIGISAVDAGCGIQSAGYSVDFAFPVAFVDSTELSIAAEGMHRIEAVSTDNLGNQKKDTLVVAVDGTPPSCRIDIGEPSYRWGQAVLVTSRTPLSLAAFDPISNGVASGLAGLSYSVGDERFFVEDSTVAIHLSGEDRECVLEYSALDRVNNRTITDSVTLILDNTPPSCVIDLPYDTTLVNRTISIIGTAADPHFSAYQIEYGAGLSPQRWFQDGFPVDHQVIHSLLKEFDTAQLPSRTPFLLRTIATDLVGKESSDTILLQTGDLIVSDTLELAMPTGVEATGLAIYLCTETGLLRTTPELDHPQPIYDMQGLKDVVRVPDGGLFVSRMADILKGRPPQQPEPFVDGLEMANGLELDSGFSLYVTQAQCDIDGGEVLRFDEEGRQTLKIGDLRRPLAVAVDQQSCIYVTDTDRHMIRKFDRHGQRLLQFGSFGTIPGKMDRPGGISIEPNGYIWISDTGNGRLQVFDPLGNRLYDFKLPSSNMRGASEPSDLDIVSGRSIYVIDRLNRWVVHLEKPRLLDPSLSIVMSSRTPTQGLHIGRPAGIPNPFDPNSEAETIRFLLSADAKVQVFIYDLVGRKVRAFVFHSVKGIREVSWDGRNASGAAMPDGVYFFRIFAERGNESAVAFGKITLLR